MHRWLESKGDNWYGLCYSLAAAVLACDENFGQVREETRVSNHLMVGDACGSTYCRSKSVSEVTYRRFEEGEYNKVHLHGELLGILRWWSSRTCEFLTKTSRSIRHNVG